MTGCQKWALPPARAALGCSVILTRGAQSGTQAERRRRRLKTTFVLLCGQLFSLLVNRRWPLSLQCIMFLKKHISTIKQAPNLNVVCHAVCDVALFFSPRLNQKKISVLAGGENCRRNTQSYIVLRQEVKIVS